MNAMTVGQLFDLVEYFQKPGMVVAEIGVFFGATTRTYIDIIKKNNGRLYAIDWFVGNEAVGGEHVHGYKPDNGKNTLNLFKQNLADYLDIITILEGKSHDKIPLIPDNSLDICFIDADHRYPSVKEDIKLCIPKVKETGILCGHDYNGPLLKNKEYLNFTEEQLKHDCTPDGHLGVVKAVHESFGDNNIVLIEDVWIAKNRHNWPINKPLQPH
jgi:hypothetical protein